MSHPSTHQPMLPRPSYTTTAHATEDSEPPVSDTETESSYTLQSENTNLSSLQDHIIHLPRPPCKPKPTKQHQRPCFNKNQQNKDNPMTQKVRPTPKPSYIPVLNNKEQKPATQATQPNIQQTISSLPRPTEETSRKQPTYDHPEPIPGRRSPLLPTPPAAERISNNTNNYKHHITRPSTVNNRKSTFARPPEFNSDRFHQQHIPRPSPSPPRYNTYPTFSGPNYSYYLPPHISRPHQQISLLPIPAHQIPAFTGPYPEIPNHHTQQVYYIPIILPYLPQSCIA